MERDSLDYTKRQGSCDRYRGTLKLLRALESKASHNNKTTDNNIQSDDSEDKDKENTDAAGNGTENNDFPRDSETKDEDSGATANIEKNRSASVRQGNPMLLKFRMIKQLIQFQIAQNGKEHTVRILGRNRKASTKTKNCYSIEYIEANGIKGMSMSIISKSF